MELVNALGMGRIACRSKLKLNIKTNNQRKWGTSKIDDGTIDETVIMFIKKHLSKVANYLN